MLNLIVGYVLGVFSAFILLCLLVTHRAPPPTMAKRKQPNAQGENLQSLGPEFERVLHENLWDLYETSESGIKYEWINVAGERE